MIQTNNANIGNQHSTNWTVCRGLCNRHILVPYHYPGNRILGRGILQGTFKPIQRSMYSSWITNFRDAPGPNPSPTRAARLAFTNLDARRNSSLDRRTNHRSRLLSLHCANLQVTVAPPLLVAQRCASVRSAVLCTFASGVHAS